MAEAGDVSRAVRVARRAPAVLSDPDARTPGRPDARTPGRPDGPGDRSAAPSWCGPGAAGGASRRGRDVPRQCRAHTVL
ncbi:hypothetical protein B9W62_35210 [Streptomyces sp. CS113]|nr:hypothetical protein B9W62_35210 [Streptomyces sp. CS113]